MSPHLVPLKPALYADCSCPKCGQGGPEPLGTVFPGVHVLGEYRCRACGYAFYRDLPVGFAVDNAVSIGKEDGSLHDADGAESWVTTPLMEGFHHPSGREWKIERKVYRACKDIVLLNTLDFLYGHVLLKLWNAQYYLDHHRDKGLVLILPRSFEWLVPEGTAEVWLVDQRLGEAHGWYTCIDRFVQQRLKEYDTVSLGKGYAHPDKSLVDINRFCGVQPFPMEQFLERPKQVAFIWREDRLWFRSPFAKLAWRASNKLGLKPLVHKWFVADQERLVRATWKKIKHALPDAEAMIVGLGRPSTGHGAMEDLRRERMDKETELEWCRAYARCQVVIGVHGSNMLLPTALAAGCIEVLPHDRFGNMVQDIAVRYHDLMQLFLYRFVDEFAPPATVARHAIGMFRDFKVYYRDNKVNVP